MRPFWELRSQDTCTTTHVHQHQVFSTPAWCDGSQISQPTYVALVLSWVYAGHASSTATLINLVHSISRHIQHVGLLVNMVPQFLWNDGLSGHQLNSFSLAKFPVLAWVGDGVVLVVGVDDKVVRILAKFDCPAEQSLSTLGEFTTLLVLSRLSQLFSYELAIIEGNRTQKRSIAVLVLGVGAPHPHRNNLRTHTTMSGK